jgi:hypothetical protein
VNQNTAFSGNDFALDDISLSTAPPGGVPEPATWAMMIAGFGLPARRCAVAAARSSAPRATPSRSGTGRPSGRPFSHGKP